MKKSIITAVKTNLRGKRVCFCRLWRKNRRQTPTSAQGKPFSAPHQATLAANAYGCTGNGSRSKPTNCHSANGGNAHKPPERAAVLRNVSGARALCASAKRQTAGIVCKTHFKSAPHTEGIARATCVSAHKKYCCNKPKTSRSAHGSHAQLHPRTCATHAERRSTTTKRNGQIARSL